MLSYRAQTLLLPGAPRLQAMKTRRARIAQRGTPQAAAQMKIQKLPMSRVNRLRPYFSPTARILDLCLSSHLITPEPHSPPCSMSIITTGPRRAPHSTICSSLPRLSGSKKARRRPNETMSPTRRTLGAPRLPPWNWKKGTPFAPRTFARSWRSTRSPISFGARRGIPAGGQILQRGKRRPDSLPTIFLWFTALGKDPTAFRRQRR